MLDPVRKRLPQLLRAVAAAFLWFASQGSKTQAVALGEATPAVHPQQGLYFGFEPPGDTPVLLAPNLVSTRREHSAAMFAPDGTEIWFARIYPPEILYVKRIDGVWSAPQTAPFSGEYADLYPSLTADGNRLFFTSQRPPSPSDSPLPRGQGLLWYAERTETGWSDAKRFDLITDPRSLASCVSVAANGNLYLGMRNLEEPDLSMDIYYVRFEDGRYLEPERLQTINSATPDHSPFVAPDERYLIWSSFRGGQGLSDLFISFRGADGGWSEPRNLGPRINSGAKDEYPYVTPDGRFLVFNSNRASALNPNPIPDGPGNIYWVEAAAHIAPSP
jgi:hypothetical protein